MSIESVIEEVKEIISEHRSTYLSNETAVRDHLINPILNELGWNTRNPKFVLPNAPSDDGKIPDYILMKNGKKMLVVEAKNMGVELNDSKIINQIASYCYTPGIKFGVLTNGIKWLLFNTFQANPNERIAWRADIEKDRIEDIKIKLNCISYDQAEKIEWLSSEIYKDEVLERMWNMLIQDRNQMIETLSSQIQHKLRSDHPTTAFNAKQLKDFINEKLETIFYTKNAVTITNDQDKEKVDSDQEDIIKNDANDGHKTRHTKSKLRVKIRVIFPDGTEIYHKKVADTFVEAIQKIGAEKIKKLNLLLNGIPIVSDKKDEFYGKSQRLIPPNYFIMTHSSTPGKIKCLYEINERLNSGMKIEEIEPTLNH